MDIADHMYIQIQHMYVYKKTRPNHIEDGFSEYHGFLHWHVSLSDKSGIDAQDE